MTSAIAAIMGLNMLLIQQTPQDRATTLTGNIEKIDAVKSAKLGNSRTVLVYLPPQYKREHKRKFPVLFLHDGQNVFDGATSYIAGKEWKCDETAEQMIKSGKIQPIIMVAIYNNGADRMNEFVSTTFQLRDGTKYGGKGAAYLDFIVKELRPMIAKKYRTLDGPQNTAIAGASLGGVISLDAGIRYPLVFGKLGLMSTSLWINDGEQMRRTAKAAGKKMPWKIWADVGTEEGEGMVTSLTELEKVFKKAGGVAGKNYSVMIDQGGQHNEDAWARRFPMMLKFFFGK